VVTNGKYHGYWLPSRNLNAVNTYRYGWVVTLAEHIPAQCTVVEVRGITGYRISQYGFSGRMFWENGSRRGSEAVN